MPLVSSLGLVSCDVVLPAPLLEPVQLPRTDVSHPPVEMVTAVRRPAMLSPARTFLSSFISIIHLLSVCEINSKFFYHYNLAYKKMVSVCVRFSCKILTDGGISIYPTGLVGLKQGRTQLFISELLVGHWLLPHVLKPKAEYSKKVQELDKFIVCAVSTSADFIVTGDNDLLGLGKYKSVKIISASVLLKMS